VASVRRAGDRWELLDAQGRVVVTADAVVAAAGWGVEALLETGAALSPVRGQADWRDGASVEGAAWGGYAAPTGAGLLYGATHTRGDVDLTPRDADSRQNLETLKARLPQLAARLSEEGGRRVAVRATTRDRLPVAGRRRDGLYILSGLGSRGFCVAPLLGEHVAALIAGRPSPLPASLAERVSPDRF